MQASHRVGVVQVDACREMSGYARGHVLRLRNGCVVGSTPADTAETAHVLDGSPDAVVRSIDRFARGIRCEMVHMAEPRMPVNGSRPGSRFSSGPLSRSKHAPRPLRLRSAPTVCSPCYSSWARRGCAAGTVPWSATSRSG